MGTLFIIATPIGNLEDVTYRAIETLRGLDVLFCEDTRVTRRLLDRYGLVVPMDSYREEAHREKLARVLGHLREDKRVGLVSDAGTPAISDPGFRLVRDVLAAEPSTTVVPIPGPSAVATALSASGFPSDQFLFLGFPPHKKGRQSAFAEAMGQERTVVLYESPHRIGKALAAIGSIDPARTLCVGRELTKIHETFYRGTAQEVAARLEQTSSRGEFVIVISPKP
ncbi:MAG: ribosomal small subunit methyltransferase [Candidatus Parcubacteria bacterium]|jgi:16S rRNA (cytidine1402-2'-O)-methyltransferase